MKNSNVYKWGAPDSAQRKFLVEVVCMKLQKHGISPTDADRQAMESDRGTKLSQMKALLQMWGDA